MHHRWTRRLIIAALCVAVPALAVVGYLKRPLFGAQPAGARLAQIAQSPHYHAGEFRNQIATPVLTTDQSAVSMLVESIFSANHGHPRPAERLPSIKTDLASLDKNQDLVVWLGHSSYYVQLSGQRILVDPVFSSNAAPVPAANVAFDGSSPYSAADMPAIDYLLISHDHYDHLDYPTVAALRPKISNVVAGLGVGADFEEWGFARSRIHEADWNDTIAASSDLTIHVTPARHFSGRTLMRNTTLWAGYALVSKAHRLFFSGDSGYGPHFASIGRQFGPSDWVTLDTGQYDPRWAYVHMNPEQAVQAADDLRTKVFMPGHIGRFSLAPHDWDDPFKRVSVAARGHAYALWTPIIGQPVYLDNRSQQFEAWWTQYK